MSMTKDLCPGHTKVPPKSAAMKTENATRKVGEDLGKLSTLSPKADKHAA